MDADGGSADGPPTSAGDGGEKDEDGNGERCTICWCGRGGDSGELLQRGCCCRGDIGLVHLECITKLAAHAQTGGSRDAWYSCGTCSASTRRSHASASPS